MSTDYQSLTGEYHLILKLSGTPTSISLFHRLMRRCDNDWPWKENTGGRVCETCFGIVYKGPRINPEDLKIGAKQVGDVRVKIRSFIPEAKCKNSFGFVPTRWIQKELLEALYLPHGPANLKLMIEAEKARWSRNTTNTPAPLVIPAGKPSIILATEANLDDGGNLHPAGDGSLIQFPGDAEWDGVIQ